MQQVGHVIDRVTVVVRAEEAAVINKDQASKSFKFKSKAMKETLLAEVIASSKVLR